MRRVFGRYAWFVAAVATAANLITVVMSGAVSLDLASPDSDPIPLLLTAGLSAIGFGYAAYLLWRGRYRIRSLDTAVRVVYPTEARGASPRRVAPLGPSGTPLYVDSIELNNIRCFEHLHLDLAIRDQPNPTILVVGDNGSGKSTLLRALAIGLSPESEAVGLMKRLPGTLLRTGATEGNITVVLRSPGRDVRITTRIINTAGQERVRQTTSPRDLDWDDIFVCGYGTQRTSEGSLSYERYERQHAVGTLFSETAVLMNPELVLLRSPIDERDVLKNVLLEILMLEDWDLKETQRGLELTGPTGSQQLNSAADGYRTTAQWVLDYLGWQFLARRVNPERLTSGILLIDEIEQHLHPRWQRHVLQRVREQFPESQLIVTTHTPLVVSGSADLQRAKIVSLDGQTHQSETVPRYIDPKVLKGRHADQVLASVFGLWTTKSPGSASALDRYAALLSIDDRTPQEESEMQELLAEVRDSQQAQTHSASRRIEEAITRVLDEMAAEASARVAMEPEVRRQLQEILNSGDSKSVERRSDEEGGLSDQD